MTNIEKILQFLSAAENLKNTLRSARTSSGRQESTAEHTWRLTLMVMLFADELEGVDQLRLIKLCIVHDLGEAISGDIPAIYQDGNSHKAEQERRDLEELCSCLPADQRNEIIELWEEYEASETLEAKLAKGFDKLETMHQHNDGKNPADFDYEFNLTYGLSKTDKHPLLQEIRKHVDAATRSNMHTGKMI